MESPLCYFSALSDPRVERTREHNLEDILFIAIASIICGAESWNDMETFGNAKKEWLKTFLQLPNLLKNERTAKAGVRGKRLKAGWNNRYLMQLIKN